MVPIAVRGGCLYSPKAQCEIRGLSSLFLHRYEVNFQTGIDCGGAYVKLLSQTPDLDLVSLRHRFRSQRILLHSACVFSKDYIPHNAPGTRFEKILHTHTGIALSIQHTLKPLMDTATQLQPKPLLYRGSIHYKVLVKLI